MVLWSAVPHGMLGQGAQKGLECSGVNKGLHLVLYYSYHPKNLVGYPCRPISKKVPPHAGPSVPRWQSSLVMPPVAPALAILWGSTESWIAQISGNAYTLGTSTVTMLSTSAKVGEPEPTFVTWFPPSPLTSLKVLAFSPDWSPGTAVFRPLPESAVEVTVSPSAVTPSPIRLHHRWWQETGALPAELWFAKFVSVSLT